MIQNTIGNRSEKTNRQSGQCTWRVDPRAVETTNTNRIFLCLNLRVWRTDRVRPKREEEQKLAKVEHDLKRLQILIRNSYSWEQGSPTICTLRASSLSLSACFIYDKRAWVTYCSLNWQWYNFEMSNLSNGIDFIIFPVANEKQRLSVVLIMRRFL